MRQIVRQIAIGFDGQQTACGGQPLQRSAQVVADHAFDLGRVLDKCLQAAIFQQPFHRRFGADFGHAGHVVHGVADQVLVVQHQVWRNAEFGFHASEVTAFAVHGVDDHDALGDQLCQILVAAADHHVPALGGGAVRQGADHIVGLHTRHVQHPHTEQAGEFMDRLDLRAQIVRHGRAVGFVLRVNRIAKGWAFGVEHAGHVGSGNLLFQGLHHVDEAADRTSGWAGGVGRVGAQVRHGVESAVQVAGSVDQQQSCGG